MVKDGKPIRASKELINLINQIRADFIKKGKTPPSSVKITRALVKSSGEGIRYDQFIPFK